MMNRKSVSAMMGQESRKVKAILSYLKEVLFDPNLIISGQHKSCCIQEDCIFAPIPSKFLVETANVGIAFL